MKTKKAFTGPKTAKEAVAYLEQVVEKARATNHSKQPRFGNVDSDYLFTSLYRWYKTSLEDLRRYPYKPDSRERDSWLEKFWRTESHLAGIVNSVVAIDKNRNWILTGPQRQVTMYSNILRNAENGLGWRDFASVSALSYYTSDINTVIEIGRQGPLGPMRALYNVDSSRCRLTGNREFPLEYFPKKSGKPQKWRPTDYFRVAALPSAAEDFNHLGWCAVSRCIDLVMLLMAVYEYDQEQLGARAPKGLLLLQNISEVQWENAMQVRETELDSRERDYYGGVAVLAQEGMDQIDAKLVALSNLPQDFDRESMTNMIMYGIALAFGYTADEFWPVQYGALGRSRETEIHHMRATAKGGSDYVLGFQEKIQRELPSTVYFEFDKRDGETDMLEAEVYFQWAKVVDMLYNKGEGTLDREEVRNLLFQKNIIPKEVTDMVDSHVSTSMGINRSLSYVRDEMLSKSEVLRAIQRFPQEPVVRYSWATGQTEVLWEQGEDAIKQRSWGISTPKVVATQPKALLTDSTIKPDYTVVQGDTPPLTITVKDKGGSLVDLGQVRSVSYMLYNGEETPKVHKTLDDGIFVDGSTVRVNFSSEDTLDLLGDYTHSLVITDVFDHTFTVLRGMVRITGKHDSA